MARFNLSEGALEVIMNEGDYQNPVLQVLGTKELTVGSADKKLYRILLSDGTATICNAVLMTRLYKKGDVLQFAVIKINRYITYLVQDSAVTKVLLILDMDVIAQGEEVGEKLGDPKPLEGSFVQQPYKNSSNASSSNVSATNIAATSASAILANENSIVTNGSSLGSQPTQPISSLNPYRNKWLIKARVTNKPPVRSWSNSKGEGKFFTMDLVDESGEIRCIGFRDAVDKFYNYIQVDKVYYITNCQLVLANKQFSTHKNDYEMTITRDTVIQGCVNEDSSSLPQIKYDFVTIDKIQTLEVNTMIDIIGIAKRVSDLQTFRARSTGKELKKKDILLVDQSNTAVTLTLWGADAENFNSTNNPVIVVKGGRISEFGGAKCVSAVSNTFIKVNHDMKECYHIRAWYDREGRYLDANNISAKSVLSNLSIPWMSFKEVIDQGLGNGERGDFYQVIGTILAIRSENAVYKACPTAECFKKVVDLDNGMYRCEKCNREFPNYRYRLLASMNVGDWSGNQWVTMFSSEAEKIIGMTSQEVGQQIEEDSNAMAAIAEKACFKQFIMKCHVKMETYNDKTCLKTVCIKVDPVNYEKFNTDLIERIRQFIN